ncbi:MAG: DNA repair protein RadC [Candidatus Thermoplasmatota archaeon]|jgi:DNA repair protein RadC|nr:DNA repair protein RadC [Candidatus Thermoplasmatota archaeon]
MKIKDIPWFNRPGARLRKKGVFSLSDAELLAIVIGRGDKTENAIDMANRVLAKNNFDKMSELSLPELEKEFKNPVKAMKIIAMFEIFRRTNKLMKKGYKLQIKNASDVYHYFVDELQNKTKEYFYALFLDTKNRILKDELVSIGTLNESLIHPREIFNSAVSASCNSVIIVHNHPSGDCVPSDSDKEVTRVLVEAGNIMGIKVLDHVIIGKEGFTSLKENGLM